MIFFRALYRLGIVLRSQAKYEESLIIFQSQLNIRLKRNKNHSLTIADIMNQIAIIYYATGKHQEAKSLSENALIIRKDLLGESHSDTLDLINNLANINIELSRFNEAEALHRNIVSLRKQVNGEKSAEFAHSINNLGHAKEKNGNYNQALECYKKSIEIYEKCLGSNNSDITFPLSNLGLALTELGDKDGRLYQLKALEIAERVYNHDHPRIANILINLSVTDEVHEDRKSHVQRAYEISKNKLGNHLFTIVCLHHLSIIHEEENNFHNAEYYLQNALEMGRTELGENSKIFSDTLLMLGSLYYRYDENAQALAFLKQSLTIQENLFDANNLWLVRTLRPMAWIADETEDHQTAFNIFLRVYNIIQNNYTYKTRDLNIASQDLINAGQDLAEQCLKLDNKNEATTYMLESLRLSELNHDFHSKDHFSTRLKVAKYFIEIRSVDQAELNLNICKAISNENHTIDAEEILRLNEAIEAFHLIKS